MVRQVYPADRDARDTARARAAFVELRGDQAAALRKAEIDELPAVTWKGKPLRTLRCCGTSGKGPHTQHVTEALLWALIDLRHWFCPFHPSEMSEAVS